MHKNDRKLTKTQLEIPTCFLPHLDSLKHSIRHFYDQLVPVDLHEHRVYRNRGALRASERAWLYNPGGLCARSLEKNPDEQITYRLHFAFPHSQHLAV